MEKLTTMYNTLKEYLEKRKEVIDPCHSFHESDGMSWTPCGHCGLRRDEKPKMDRQTISNINYNQALDDLIADLPTLIPLIKAEVMGIVNIGNLDPDFEYKKEYYKGHNELQEHLRTALSTYFEKRV